MENDPNKKESKGKRILKKALRRGSKTSSSGSAAADSILESRRLSIDIKDKTEDSNGAKTKSTDVSLTGAKEKKIQIREDCKKLNVETASDKNLELKSSQKLENKDFSKAECSKKLLKRKVEEETETGAGTSAGGASDTEADDKDPSKDKKKKNRCAVCRKKVGLTGFECRCGGLFCAVHRYSDKHECSFDYRELGAQEIRRNNPVVVSQKIHKI